MFGKLHLLLNIQLLSWVLITNTVPVPAPIYNDLSSHYEDSLEPNLDGEEKWLMLDKIQALTSLILRNASQICPLEQSATTTMQFYTAEKLVHSTLTEIYETEDSFDQIVAYGDLIAPIQTRLTKCLKDDNSKLSQTEFLSANHSNRDEWQDFSSCIRSTRSQSPFQPEIIPHEALDLLWHSFLLSYFACKDYWISDIETGDFYETIRKAILAPLLKRWNTIFPGSTGILKTEAIIHKTSGETSSDSDIASSQPINFGKEYVTTSLEKCNVILFLKQAVDPIPCFKDIMLHN